MLVDYRKLDAGLAAALEDAGDDAGLPVFVHVDPQEAEAARPALEVLGVTGPLQAGIATATVSPDQVRRLSDLPEVRQIRLATPLQLME